MYRYLLLLIKVIDARKVDVYHLQQNDKLTLQDSNNLIFPPVFSICLSFLIDKFSYMETVDILQLKQRDKPQLDLHFGLQLDLNEGLPNIILDKNINGEGCIQKNTFLFIKNVWTRLCIGLDWKNYTFGKNIVNKDFPFLWVSEKEKSSYSYILASENLLLESLGFHQQ